MARPGRLVAVVGTGTDVGKTWVTARLIRELREAGRSVAVRKPAQSFDPADDPSGYDATLLGAASGEAAEIVCPQHRWYEVAFAPPMAAHALGRPAFTVADLVGELRWPESSDGPPVPPATAGRVDVGLVETAGGVRSPLASDGDCLELCRALDPELVVLVADAGLGTINAVRLTMSSLLPLHARIIVVLNRFDGASELHSRNLEWLRTSDDLPVFVVPGDEHGLALAVMG